MVTLGAWSLILEVRTSGGIAGSSFLHECFLGKTPLEVLACIQGEVGLGKGGNASLGMVG